MSSCCTCSIPNLRPPAHSFLSSLKSHCRAVAKCVHSRSKARLRKLEIIAKLPCWTRPSWSGCQCDLQSPMANGRPRPKQGGDRPTSCPYWLNWLGLVRTISGFPW